MTRPRSALLASVTAAALLLGCDDPAPRPPGGAAVARDQSPSGRTTPGEPGGTLAQDAALGPAQDGTIEVRLDVAGEPLRARITAASAAALDLRPGLAVLALVKSVALGPDAAMPEL